MKSKTTHTSAHIWIVRTMCSLPPAVQEKSILSPLRPRIRATRPPAHNKCSGGLVDGRRRKVVRELSQAANSNEKNENSCCGEKGRKK